MCKEIVGFCDMYIKKTVKISFNKFKKECPMLYNQDYCNYYQFSTNDKCTKSNCGLYYVYKLIIKEK